MEPSDLRKLHDPSHLWRLNLSKKRSLLAKQQVGSGAQVIIEVARARTNRLKNAGSTTPQIEEDAAQFVGFVTGEVLRTLGRANQT